MSMDFEQVAKAGKQFKEISDIVASDKDAVTFLDVLVASAGDYVSNVTIMTATQRYGSSEDSMAERDLREKIARQDAERRLSHNSLISNLHGFNRYLFMNKNQFEVNGKKIPEGGVYSLDPMSIHDRVAVADWAGYLTLALKLEKEKECAPLNRRK